MVSFWIKRIISAGMNTAIAIAILMFIQFLITGKVYEMITMSCAVVVFVYDLFFNPYLKKKSIL